MMYALTFYITLIFFVRHEVIADGLEPVRDVYPTNFMFRRRRIKTEREKKDPRMETRVKVDGCRAVVSEARLSREHAAVANGSRG